MNNIGAGLLIAAAILLAQSLQIIRLTDKQFVLLNASGWHLCNIDDNPMCVPRRAHP